MDTLFFIVAKVVGFFLLVETWLAVGLFATLLAVWQGRRERALRRGGLTLALLALVGTLPLGDLLLRPLEAPFPPRDAPERLDGIIILGGSENLRSSAHWDAPQLNQAAERLVSGAALARAHPDARVVYTGGSGRLRDAFTPGQDLPSVGQDVLVSLGVAPDRIVWEGESRNTAENARLTRALVRASPGEDWVLVTSAFHMGRALSSFEAAGWPPLIPYPVDHRSGRFMAGIGWDLPGKLAPLNMALKEWTGRLAYRAFAR